MQAIDYPKVKDEIVEMHNNGESIEKIDEIINENYDFTVNGTKVDMIPIIKQVILERQ